MSPHLDDEKAIEVVELLVVAVESCRMADALVSADLGRIAGVDPELTELGHDAARLAAMLARRPGPSRPGPDQPGQAASAAVIDEVVALCRRLRLKYVREQLEEAVLTARAQRWDHAELLRLLLVAEVEGRARSTIEAKRRRARFPAGKTFDTWVESRSSIPGPPSGPWAAWSGWPEPRTWWWPGRRARASRTCWRPSAPGRRRGAVGAWFSVEDVQGLRQPGRRLVDRDG